MKNGLALALLATGALAIASQVPGSRFPSPARGVPVPMERDLRVDGNPWALWQGSRNVESAKRLARGPYPSCESDGRGTVDLSVLAFHKRVAMGLQ